MWVLLLLLAATVSKAKPTDVDTAEDLYAAVKRGDAHIRVTKHLDTRRPILAGNCTSGTPECYAAQLTAVPVSWMTKSITGSCNQTYQNDIDTLGPPFAPELAELKEGQCLLITDKAMFSVLLNVTGPAPALWLNNLLIRTHRMPQEQKEPTWGIAVTGTLWLSNVTMQNDAGPAQAVLASQSSRVHAEDSTFQDFTYWYGTAALAQDNTTMHFERCVFLRNNATREPGVITLQSLSRNSAASFVALRNCSFVDNTPAGEPVLSLVTRPSGTFYSDEPRAVFDQSAESQPLQATALREAPLGSGRFAEGAAAMPEFDALQRDARGLPRAQPPPPPVPSPVATPAPVPAPAAVRPPLRPPLVPPPRPGGGAAGPEAAADGGGGSGGGMGVGVIVAAVCAGAMLPLLGALLVWRCVWSRRKRWKDGAEGKAPSAKGASGPGLEAAHAAYHAQDTSPQLLHSVPGAAQHSAPGITETTITGARFDPSSWEAAPSATHHAASGGSGHMRVQPGGAAAASAGSGRAARRTTEGTHSTLGAETSSTFGAKTHVHQGFGSGGGGSSVDELEDALDELAERGLHFMGRYLLGSNVERRSGGQGVVQFARIANTPDQVAIKFYTHAEAFEREAQLYANPAFKELMPATLAIEDNSSRSERLREYAFPPCIIIEKGQSLNEWAHANRCDFVTIFQALSHSVRALAALHDMGYAHRDIKPGNILRRPKQHDWTLIDFGCAARIGVETPVSFSLVYAAPETVLALESGNRTVTADAAVDIWAVGVIAFELLTGERTFPFAAQRGEVLAAIAGRTPLPWEGGAPRAAPLRARMRGLKRTVLQCLRRDPEARPTAADLLAAWDHLFDSIQTQSEGAVPSDVSGLSGPGGTTGLSAEGTGGMSSGVSGGACTGATGTPLL